MLIERRGRKGEDCGNKKIWNFLPAIVSSLILENDVYYDPKSIIWINPALGCMMQKTKIFDWFLRVNKLLQKIRLNAFEALKSLRRKDQSMVRVHNNELKTVYSSLCTLWKEGFPLEELGYLERHIDFGEIEDYENILSQDVPKVERIAEEHLLRTKGKFKEIGFENLLHPVIIEHAYQQYRDGHLRDAVLNSVIAVFDLIRLKTGLTEDGDRLVCKVLSTQDPYLILSELGTESGRNDQTGFIQIFQGAYKGIRNPKAHSLEHDLTEQKAAQYLVFASLLARRIDEAQLAKGEPKKVSKKEGGKKRPVS